MSIKAAILEKAEASQIEFAEYTNLILDDMQVEAISTEDSEFLTQFKECKCLALNSCHLNSLQNLPQIPTLQRLELNDNKVTSVKGVKWPTNLHTIKLANNQIKDLNELIESLKPLASLEAVDISSSPCSSEEGTDHVKLLREALPNLKAVDGKD